MHISSRIDRDLRRLVGGNQLNSCPVTLRWRVPRRGWVHHQTTGASQWVVEHGLGGYALCQVITSDGAVLRVGMRHVDASRMSVEFSSVETGTVVCVRPDRIVPLGSQDATIAHDLSTRPLCQVIDATGAVVMARVSWPTASSVRVEIEGDPAGMQVLLAAAEHVSQHAAASVWTVAHDLGALPILQCMDDAGFGVIPAIPLVTNAGASLHFSSAIDGVSIAVARGAANYAHDFEDRNVESTVTASEAASMVVAGLVHFVQPVKSGMRLFAEFEAGDVIVDLVQDVAVDGKRGLIFEIDGKEYVQKEAGDAIAKYWDLVIGGRRMMRTLLLTLRR